MTYGVENWIINLKIAVKWFQQRWNACKDIAE